MARCGCFHQLGGGLFVRVLIVKALQFGVYIRALNI